MENILENYKINFSRPINDRELITSTNMWLSQFINDHYRLSDINRLIEEVNLILNNGTTGGVSTQSLQYASISQELTKIYEDEESYYENENIDPSFVLPTQDFKIIAQKWKEFLES